MVGKETFDLVSLWIALLFPWLCPGRFARFVLWLGLRFVARQTLILPRNNGICNKKNTALLSYGSVSREWEKEEEEREVAYSLRA